MATITFDTAQSRLISAKSPSASSSLTLRFPKRLRYSYLKAFSVLPSSMSFSSLFASKLIKNKTLSKIQRYLLHVATEKNKIFTKFIDNNLLPYDYMPIRDQKIRSLFDNKYPKYSVKMYQLFYKQYVKEKKC